MPWCVFIQTISQKRLALPATCGLMIPTLARPRRSGEVGPAITAGSQKRTSSATLTGRLAVHLRWGGLQLDAPAEAASAGGGMSGRMERYSARTPFQFVSGTRSIVKWRF